MFDNLLKLVSENAGEAIINNPSIPNERNEEAIKEASSGIMNQLGGLMNEGGISAITDLFQGGNLQNNPAISKITNSVAGNLMEKFGLNSSQASDIVAKLIPTVLGKLVNKTNDPSDNSFDLQDIVKSIGGSGGGNILGQVKGMFGM